MKRFRFLTLVAIVAMLLGLTGVVYAGPPMPQFIQYLNVDTNPAYIGDTVNYSSQMYGDIRTSGAAQTNPCVVYYIPGSSSLGTDTGTLAAQTGSYIQSDTGNLPATCGSTNPGDAGASYDRYYAQVTQTGSNQYANWTLNMPNTLSGVTAANYNVQLCINFGSFSGTSWICSELDPDLTINAAATTRYVANTEAQCLGHTPCDTGTGGLAAALGNSSATTIIVIGTYNANPATSHTLAGGDTLKGSNNASININGVCASSGAFLNVTGASTIQDLTFDGTCTSGGFSQGININAAGSTVTVQDITIQDFTNTGLQLVAGTLNNTGVTYDGNGTGASVTGGTAVFDNDTFTGNTTAGLAISNGSGTVTNSSFESNGIGVNHTAGTAVIGGISGMGNTFTDNSTAGISAGTGATIKDNTISGGINGIALTSAPMAIYANTVSGASGNQINCSGGAFSGAGFNYIGGNYGGGGSNCTDAEDQLGSPIVAWTDGTSLGSCTAGSAGPIFDLGNNSPFGLTPPLGRDSKYYATTSGAGDVTVTGGTTQFKMHMNGDNDTGSEACNPMTEECWESSSNGRGQSGAGYYFSGSQDPTAVTLTDITARSANTWLPVGLVAGLSVLALGALFVLRKRQAL